MTRSLLAIPIFVALTACPRTPELQTRVQTVEVRTPVVAPCPNQADVPALPQRVAAEHPAMPRRPDGTTDYEAVSRILGAKVLELFGYADQADGIMRACARADR